tara:strand:- start:290 stop:700 length:411 start_codon:yes stop_codon:yes gene_type:complete
MSCGYTPIYSNLKNKDINIEIQKISGNEEINNLINQKLSRYQNKDSELVYNIEVKSNFEKSILTKDTAGNATNFRLNLNIMFIFMDNGNLKEFVFSEKFDMKKGNNIFEDEKYENIIKNDMTNIIIQRFISRLQIE